MRVLQEVKCQEYFSTERSDQWRSRCFWLQILCLPSAVSLTHLNTTTPPPPTPTHAINLHYLSFSPNRRWVASHIVREVLCLQQRWVCCCDTLKAE